MKKIFKNFVHKISYKVKKRDSAMEPAYNYFMIADIFLRGAFDMLLLIGSLHFLQRATRMHQQLGYTMLLWFVCCLPEMIEFTPYYASQTVQFTMAAIAMLPIPSAAFISTAITGGNMLKKKEILMHEGPFILIAAIVMLTENKWVLNVGMLYGLIYLVATFELLRRKLIRYRKCVKYLYSNKEGRSTRWILQMMMLIPFVFVAYSITTMWMSTWANLLYYIVAIIVWAYSMFAFERQKPIDYSIVNVTPTEDDEFDPVEHNREDAEYPFAEDLERALMEPRLFTNPNLTLSDLCQTLNLEPKRVTEYFVKQSGTTFYDAVNEQRLSHVAQMLLRTQYSIGTISNESGFTSMKKMAQMFKNEFGITPQQYRDQQ